MAKTRPPNVVTKTRKSRRRNKIIENVDEQRNDTPDSRDTTLVSSSPESKSTKPNSDGNSMPSESPRAEPPSELLPQMGSFQGSKRIHKDQSDLEVNPSNTGSLQVPKEALSPSMQMSQGHNAASYNQPSYPGVGIHPMMPPMLGTPSPSSMSSMRPGPMMGPLGPMGPVPSGQYPMIPPIPMMGNFNPEFGSWVPIVGPYGQQVMAWVPNPYATQTKSQVPNDLGSAPQYKPMSPKSLAIEEQNKERVRIRESRRVETLRRYMEGPEKKPSTCEPQKEPYNPSERSASTTGSDPNLKNVGVSDSAAEKKDDNHNHDSSIETDPSQPIPTSFQANVTTQTADPLLQNPSSLMAPMQNSPHIVGPSSQIPLTTIPIVAPLNIDPNSGNNVVPRSAQRLYGDSQPRSYGYGDIIPENIEHKTKLTKADHDRALEMLTKSFEEFRRNRTVDHYKEENFPEHLADSAALLANFNKTSSFARQMAHRHIEEEYANQRRDFHDAIDSLKVPAIQNPEGRWICALCPQKAPTYAYYKHLLRHAANHLDIKPFKCPFCFRRFRRSDTARRHQASCVQLAVAVQKRMGYYANSSKPSENMDSAITSSSSSVTSLYGSSVGSAQSQPGNDETSEEELDDDNNDETSGNDSQNDAHSIANPPQVDALQIPPVVMPIQK